MNADEDRLNEITEAIIGAAFALSNTLGSGFLEKVYENALALELRLLGLNTVQHAPIEVLYRQECVGEYFADLLVENSVIVELKAIQKLDPTHMAQVMNYLNATGFKIGLLVNFGQPRVEVKRLVHNLK
ncbi:MAG: GxxExxY protein [Chrysiogenetes bacterium]|nr:GxxExxY protein [Chrysiogenetes bacterium]